MKRHPFSCAPRQATMQVLALTLMAVLGGCAMPATQPSDTAGSVMTGTQGKPVGEELSQWLARAHPGEVIQLGQSPWGREVQVEVGSLYYAASGRVCRELTVRQGGLDAERREIACETAAGNWVTRRQVTASQSSSSQSGSSNGSAR
ncbi:hypothetical protein HNO52_02020 [Billgrantia diversa]|uniref:DVU3141 family protein n=1 Tax=Halomonas sp. MCCC 1A13316 TaxID=2733487 RepID=UPI0018A4AD00|nr:DVU3141 family protein [Halomonas sp. MCCC 1A13316]QOR37423.1 hypothetical protein HNO52_02020 [Halomonas sp. MCCC 1A13316]